MKVRYGLTPIKVSQVEKAILWHDNAGRKCFNVLIGCNLKYPLEAVYMGTPQQPGKEISRKVLRTEEAKGCYQYAKARGMLE